MILNDEKYIILTRGIPGSGKSTFVKNNFTNTLIWHIVSSDDVRLHMNGLTEAGKISQENPWKVWCWIKRDIEDAIKVGQSIVLDSTGIDKKLLKTYKKLADENNYEFLIISFSNVPYLECLRRNSIREKARQVPEDVIERMYQKMLSQDISNYNTIDYKYVKVED